MTVGKVTHIQRLHMETGDHSTYQRLFQLLPEGVCVVNGSGRVDYVNEAFITLFQLEVQQIMGKSVFQVAGDELMLEAFKKKKRMVGTVLDKTRGTRLTATVVPMWEADSFCGILAFYQREGNTLGSPTGEVVPLKQDPSWEIELNPHFSTIIGNNQRFKRVLAKAQKAAGVSSTVLLRGESGTGKELVAKAIHRSSERKGEPFVKINCGAIPPNLLESELFGHEQGAFTGALRRRIGKFEEVGKGTLFLDEIGDLPLEMQVKLLRALQEKEFERVGGNEVLTCEARIIAATHRDLETMVAQGLFREDLFYRLQVIPVEIPSLRERREDILLLSTYFLERMSRQLESTVTSMEKEVQDAFEAYHWPGNIRELENLMERMLVLAEGEQLTLADVPPHISEIYELQMPVAAAPSLINLTAAGQIATWEEYEKHIVQQAIRTFGSFNAAGKALGVTHKTIAAKARKYRLVE
ncbi:sigma-54 interaction domain-containing protein [Anoxynatronum buryatiense]|uniref:HTH-type transcriptional regulatory protein TyrR n=1 Tax=Anoxynatronum buryatiense TaxID=489973 RepID=A0AA46AK89_9CLOT|nr:sigma 54-interacting transcriptional regulator [Anoxynatronum buryatiense]SMP67337.1 Transcriptional regulator containing PAS, AAA-type ATPase, and DNA-binding Fis domains [Anoxynatronum buryatiense]